MRYRVHQLDVTEKSILALVIHAEDDPVVPIALGEYSAATIPGARFLRLKDGGHFACVIHWQVVLPAIHEFMENPDTGGRLQV